MATAIAQIQVRLQITPWIGLSGIPFAERRHQIGHRRDIVHRTEFIMKALKAWTGQSEQEDKTNCFVSSTGVSSTNLATLEVKVQGKVTSMRKQLKAALQGTDCSSWLCTLCLHARASRRCGSCGDLMLALVKRASPWRRSRGGGLTVAGLVTAVDEYVSSFPVRARAQ